MWISEVGRTTVAHVAANLTVGNRRELQQLVLEAAARGARDVVIDLSGTDYVDTSGLGTLVMLTGRVRALGGQVRLEHVNDDVRTVMELTRLDAMLTFHAPAAEPATSDR